MKIAFTADLHLTSRARNPERFETLENILTDIQGEGIQTLIIAGDLFDASRQDYSDFEKICHQPKFQEIDIYVIPGNHDPDIDEQKIVADNLTIFTKPTQIELDDRPFLFLPYQNQSTMGQVIASLADQLPDNEWVLIGHGDWAEGLRTTNVLEPGVYMPLTRGDLQAYRPARVFLGHIHATMDDGSVHYVGSPCGLDISEAGRRRCLLYDTRTNEVTTRTVDSPLLYLNESFVIVPVADEVGYLRSQIEERKQKWDLSDEEKAKVQLRVKVAGYSADRAALQELLREAFAGFTFYKGKGPTIDNVRIADDLDRQSIAEQVRACLEPSEWPSGSDDPGREEVLLQALHIIYKR